GAARAALLFRLPIPDSDFRDLDWLRAGLAASRGDRDELLALRALFRRRGFPRFRKESLGDHEDDQSDDDEVDDGTDQVAIGDRRYDRLSGRIEALLEHDPRVPPASAGQQQPDDRIDDIFRGRRDDLADGGPDNHADRERQRVLLEQERFE